MLVAIAMMAAYGTYLVLRAGNGVPIWVVVATLVLAGPSLLLGYVGATKSEALNQNIQLVLGASVVALLLVEGAARSYQVANLPSRAALVGAGGFDRRSLAEFVRDRRKAGQLIYAYLNPAYLGLPGLTAISEVRNAYCNESGTYDEFETDGFGLRNPPNFFRRASFRPRIVLLGDSLVVGCGAKDGETMADLIRREFEPRTLNAAVGGSGPLQQYAILREYLAPLQPEVILWFYFEGNDLGNLGAEKQMPFLQYYLESDGVRGLPQRQGELREALIAWHEASLAGATRPLQVPENARPPGGSLLGGIRELLLQSLVVSRTYYLITQLERPTRALVADYGGVLEAGRRLAETWGGQIYIVYVPELARYTEWLNLQPLSFREAKPTVVEALRRRGFPVIDLEEGFTRFGGDPRRYYPMGQGTDVHFNVVGNAVAARLIMEELRTRIVRP